MTATSGCGPYNQLTSQFPGAGPCYANWAQTYPWFYRSAWSAVSQVMLISLLVSHQQGTITSSRIFALVSAHAFWSIIHQAQQLTMESVLCLHQPQCNNRSTTTVHRCHCILQEVADSSIPVSCMYMSQWRLKRHFHVCTGAVKSLASVCQALKTQLAQDL